MRNLVLLFALLSIFSPLRAQDIVLSPGQAEAYLNALHNADLKAELNNEIDTLRSIYQDAITAKNTPLTVHVLGWLSYYNYELGDPQKADEQGEESIKLAAASGMPETAKALAPAFLSLSFRTRVEKGRTELLMSALKAAEEGSVLSHDIKVNWAHSLVAYCDPKADAVFEAIFEGIKKLPAKLQPELLHQDYYGRKAYYYAHCTGDFEQAEIMQRQVMKYYKSLPQTGLNLTWYTDASIRVAALNMTMDRLPVVRELLKTIEATDLAAISPHPVPYLNMVNLVTDVYDSLDEYEKSERAWLGFLAYAEEHKAQMFPQLYDMAHEALRSTYYQSGKYDKAWEIHQLVLKSQPGFNPDQGSYSSRIPSAQGLHQVAIDSSRSFLQQLCTDCVAGQLPTVDNQFRPFQRVYEELGTTYARLGMNTYLLGVEGAKPDLAAMRRGADFLTQGKPFALKEYAKFEGSQEGDFLGGGNLTYHSKTLSAILTHIAQVTGAYDDHAAAFQAIESSKANSLKSTISAADLPPALKVRERELRQKKDLLEIQLTAADDTEKDGYQKAFLKLSDEYKDLRSSLREDYGDQLTQAFNNRDVSLSKLQQSLGENEVFLNYHSARMERTNFLITQVITRSGITSHLQKIELDFVENYAELRERLLDPLQMFPSKRKRIAELSAACYKILILPIKKEIPAGATLAICPNVELAFLPFEVLHPAGKDQDYDQVPFLIKAHPINYHYSATSLVQSRSRTVNSSAVFAFAPVFDKQGSLATGKTAFRSVPDSLIQGLRDGRIDPLPATEQEVNSLDKIYAKSTPSTLLREKATKQALLNKLNQPHRIIHLATHGYVNKNNSDLSALATYDASGEGDLLYANEIKHQNINADLVILSSCESGIGRAISGEGVLSLNRAFVSAGARNVLSTLWKIDDRYSSRFMTRFHESVASGESYSVALREAKLALLADPATALPRFWAAFVLVGR